MHSCIRGLHSEGINYANIYSYAIIIFDQQYQTISHNLCYHSRTEP